jgi:hypothetical protein
MSPSDEDILPKIPFDLDLGEGAAKGVSLKLALAHLLFCILFLKICFSSILN